MKMATKERRKGWGGGGEVGGGRRWVGDWVGVVGVVEVGQEVENMGQTQGGGGGGGVIGTDRAPCR